MLKIKYFPKKAKIKNRITLKIKGKIFKAKTNTKGKATFTLKKLTKTGTYYGKVKFSGNDEYNSIYKTVKIKIKG